MTLKIQNQDIYEEEVISVTYHNKKEIIFEISKDNEVFDLNVCLFYKEDGNDKWLEYIEVNSEEVYSSEYNERKEVYSDLIDFIDTTIVEQFEDSDNKEIVSITEGIVDKIQEVIEGEDIIVDYDCC